MFSSFSRDITLAASPIGIYVWTGGNRPPTADAGADQTIIATGPEGATVTLVGSASSDPDGDPLTFTWTGPFDSLTGVTVSPTLSIGTHTVTLTVDDGRGGTASDTVEITVTSGEVIDLSLAVEPSLSVDSGDDVRYEIAITNQASWTPPVCCSTWRSLPRRLQSGDSAARRICASAWAAGIVTCTVNVLSAGADGCVHRSVSSSTPPARSR